MGRAHEVRKKSMEASGARKAALFMRASKEIYMAAKSGIPDPNNNLSLRAAIEKFKGLNIPKDVVERAIKKAQGGDAEVFSAGRYEAIGPGGSYVIVDSLTSNVNRAYVGIRTTVNKKGAHLGVPGSVAFNFTEVGMIVFAGTEIAAIEEALILGDIDVIEVVQEEGQIIVTVNPSALNIAKEILVGLGKDNFDICEIMMLPNEYVTLQGEDKDKFFQMIDALEELEDVQNIYHNVES